MDNNKVFDIVYRIYTLKWFQQFKNYELLCDVYR